ncbi:MAG: pimA, partial [Friedmanniella sp.]|nr:pimA [Friedmanniella sp.]
MRGRSLRVGLVCPYSFDTPGGVQNHVLGLAQHLVAAGHRPFVLAPGDLSPEAARILRGADFRSAGAAIPVRYNGSVARVNFGPLSAARVRRWLADSRLDLVHLHEPITPSIALLALWAADVPVVATFHTATPRSRSMQLAGSALRAAIEKIDAGIAVSESARTVVVQHLGRDAIVIPNGFRFADFTADATDDPEADSPRTPPAGPTAGGRWRGGDRPRVLFLGRVDEPRKGLDVLLAAGPRLTAAHPDLEVVVAGQGSRALPSWCTAVGAVSEADKARLLAGADVFVAPHRARESFGIVLLEAMASGAPVVASDLSAFADLLADPGRGRLGELFVTGDPEALAAAVMAVLRGRDRSRTARAQQVARTYDWSV